MLDPRTYQMHRDALEGKVFYDNLLASPKYEQTYFPISKGSVTYDQDPRISFPVTSNTINRIASLVLAGMELEWDNTEVEKSFAEFADRVDWQEFSRSELLIKPLSVGNQLIVIRAGTKGAYFESWSGEYVFREVYQDTETVGYFYCVNKEGMMYPVIAPPDEKERASMVVNKINELDWNDKPHNFGFTPAVLFRAIDKDDSNRYGCPFKERFDKSLVKYNQVFSQILKGSLILQNVWVSTKPMDNPQVPLRLNPDTINFVGADGKLEQAIRNLDITPEIEICNHLKADISNSAETPDFMTGLRDVGKVDSGVAMSITMQPLENLCARIRYEYKNKVTELLTKAMIADYAIRGKRAPDFNLTVHLSKSVIAADKQKEIDNILRVKEASLITDEEARLAILPLLDIEPIVKAEQVVN